MAVQHLGRALKVFRLKVVVGSQRHPMVAVANYGHDMGNLDVVAKHLRDGVVSERVWFQVLDASVPTDAFYQVVGI